MIRHSHIIEFKTNSWEELCKEVNSFMQDGFLVEEISTKVIYENGNLIAVVDYYVKMTKKEIGV